MADILIKIHKAERKVVAVCDATLLGKKLSDDTRQLHINETFYGGENVDMEKLIGILKLEQADEATFNFVGQAAVQAGKQAGLVADSGVIEVQGVPHALVF